MKRYIAHRLLQGIVLLCLEADPAACHRHELVAALRRRRPGLRVIDL